MSSLFSLEGVTALITGGSRGIGQGMALELARAGANLILVQRDASNVDTKTKAEALGRKVDIVIADLGVANEAYKVMEQVDKLGVEVRILLNCAGMTLRRKAEEFDDESWDKVIQVDLTSCFQLAREAGKRMLSYEIDPVIGCRGKIINIGSIMSFQGGLLTAAYASAKGGIAQLTKNMANEWASRHVHVNCIAPGYYYTDLTASLLESERGKKIMERIPAGRWGKPSEDIGGTAVFLASRASNYVDGAVIPVDGGWLAF
ncbi:hypothetical protein CANCADRAFT_112 [Tortispora caseinolytica NRRL Y-17796]|uniref:2-deoxy-D-gluconate 3-dehydrogenase n=1 Tax=Tortispora caseinolytica NRRL Y-17796 TaxID=767744 RepID=A0A1E4TIH6_9ASCO|nr:hypothetical protein CANCADRAFT_112 [Tortispora caseinolytica NRRL Y-17796]